MHGRRALLFGRTPLKYLAAPVLLLVSAACGDSPTARAEDDVCSLNPSGAFDEWYGLSINAPSPIGEEIQCDTLCYRGTKTRWAAVDLPITLNLGPEDPDPSDPNPKDDPQAQLLMQLGAPAEAGEGLCRSEVLFAGFSTTDVREGTGEELNGKRYDYLGMGCLGSGDFAVEFDYFGPNAGRGEFCLLMQRVIISPTEPPVYAEAVGVAGMFTATAF